MVKVFELFHSIQGESTYAGYPCVFVRTTGCNLRCVYCDTKYAYEGGEDFSVDEILERIEKFDCQLVELTGGEPMLQPDLPELINRLIDDGYQVLLETNGTLPLNVVPEPVVKIVDLKTPGSGCDISVRWENLQLLNSKDQIKMVLTSEEDYLWARTIIERYDLCGKVNVLLSPSYGTLEPARLARWILRDGLRVRLQLQLHKIIWSPDMRGV